MASALLRPEASSLRPLCRYFARGFCRRGQSCRFSHDRKSAQVCRYFQRGFCRYGEQCRYQHVQEEPASAGAQNGVVLDQEPGTEPTAMDRDQGGAQDTSVQPAHSMTCVTLQLSKLEVEAEEKDENIPALGNVPCGAVTGEFVPTEAQDALGVQPREPAVDPGSSDSKAVLEVATRTDPAEVPAELGAAAAPATSSSVLLRAQSEAVECGICMDKVYKKRLPKERLFGILPNCSHAYCVGCIRKWRCSRDFHSKVIKACPECRITSNYYIPHKYWISDVDEKAELIRAFKERTGKIRCKFFIRGHCPFKSECIYLHELPPGWQQRRRRQRPRRRLRLLRFPSVSLSLSESSDDEDEELRTLEWAHTWAMLDEGSPCPSSGHEFGMLLDFIDCD